ncbi:hypothetical protein LOTGIDRAFT_175601 [Lottia gigantea]|uniref:Uncharacterized protein n=1 Tax=Lottia gigantea TaxID=225164 RepID=V4AIA4_LOTGI|nr:hypothetical protein LOTGIDRAFT_175601 [Lottia gigantea]ESO93166.1 hypothetical protein LOTGIDRAFT_175601 [Lottia gigantea]
MDKDTKTDRFDGTIINRDLAEAHFLSFLDICESKDIDYETLVVGDFGKVVSAFKLTLKASENYENVERVCKRLNYGENQIKHKLIDILPSECQQSVVMTTDNNSTADDLGVCESAPHELPNLDKTKPDVEVQIQLDNRNFCKGLLQDGKSTLVLIDSGASRSLISKSFISSSSYLRKLPVYKLKEPLKFRMGNGMCLESDYYLHLEVHIQGFTFGLYAYITNNMIGIDLVMGQDTLAQLNGNLSFRDNIFRCKTIPFYMTSDLHLRPNQSIVKNRDVHMVSSNRLSEACPKILLIKVTLRVKKVIRVTKSLEERYIFPYMYLRKKCIKRPLNRIDFVSGCTITVSCSTNTSTVCNGVSSLPCTTHKLSCPSPLVIQIINTTYGYRSECYVNGHSSCVNTSCCNEKPSDCFQLFSDDDKRAAGKCNGKKTCKLSGFREAHGIDCSGTINAYSKIKYDCVNKGSVFFFLYLIAYHLD